MVIRNLRVGLTIAAALVAIWLSITDVIVGPHGIALSFLRFVVGFGSVAFLIWYTIRRSDIHGPAKTALGKPKAEVPSPDDLSQVYADVLGSYDVATVNLFVQMLVDPPSFLERINERADIEPGSPRLRLATSQVFRLNEIHAQDGDLPRVLLVPLVRPEKGTLLDEFVVTDSSGGKVATLSNNQVRGLLVYTLEAIISFAPRATGLLAQSDGEAQGSTARALRRLAVALCSPGPRDKLDRDEKNAEIAASYAALASIGDLPTTEEWQARIRSFCEQFIDGYVIVAEVVPPVGNRLVLTYSHCVTLESPSNHSY